MLNNGHDTYHGGKSVGAAKDVSNKHLLSRIRSLADLHKFLPSFGKLSRIARTRATLLLKTINTSISSVDATCVPLDSVIAPAGRRCRSRNRLTQPRPHLSTGPHVGREPYSGPPGTKHIVHLKQAKPSTTPIPTNKTITRYRSSYWTNKTVDSVISSDTFIPPIMQDSCSRVSCRACCFCCVCCAC